MPVRRSPLRKFIERLSNLPEAIRESIRARTSRTARIASKAKHEKTEYEKKREHIEELRKRVMQRKKIKRIKHKQNQERKRYNKKRFQQNLTRAGVDSTPGEIAKVILFAAVALTVIATIVSLYFFIQQPLFTWLFGAFMIVMFATLGFGLMYGFVWVAYHQYLDMSIYRRRKEVEDVLADFLLLTSSNVRAGMTIDKALWNAVRPRFGVLAREIEVVAKKTLSGEDLAEALYDFSESYDSPLLKRSIALLVEGLTAGGEIASLLNDIALNIQETQIMRKEMASNVTTYAIFINFATLIAAPVLFALAGELLKVVTKLSGRIQIDPSELEGSGGFAFSGGSSLTYPDFLIFALLTLSMTTVLSAIIVGTIQKGSARESLSNIPLYLVINISLFFLSSHVLGGFLGGLI